MKLEGLFRPTYVDFGAGILQLEEAPEDGEHLIKKAYVNVRAPQLRKWAFDNGKIYRVTIEEVEDGD